ncbi:MAG: hypothetical protein GY821_04445 [Gammaproteobacteria bacterium]|nr:hypothetical protein [Gammaproteobacteria bacterium]
MVESYIKMASKLDSADKERLSAALLDCVKSDPIHALAAYERRKKHK